MAPKCFGRGSALCDTFKRSISKLTIGQIPKTSSIDNAKPLPSMPSSSGNSPKLRSMFDASASPSKSLNAMYPSLRPGCTTPDNPSETSSFDFASSVRSLGESTIYEAEIGVAAISSARKPMLPASTIDYRRADTLYPREPVANANRARTYGSPVPRNQRFEPTHRSTRRGFDALTANGKHRAIDNGDEILVDRYAQLVDEASARDITREKVTKGEKAPSTAKMSANKTSREGSISSSDSARRSEQFGFGATMRVATDAHSVIMGEAGSW